MHTIETRNQFIELRAQGLSLDAISAQLDVPRATLGRWHHDSIEQIQRLRAIQWHLLEEQIGHRLEDSLQRVAQRIRRWEDVLDERDPGYRNTLELVRLIRDTRREYLQLRSILLAPLQPTRGRAQALPSPASLDPQKRDKTRQNSDSSDTTSLPSNDLQQHEPAMSHSAPIDPAPNSIPPELAPPPSVAEPHNPGIANDRPHALPLPRGEGWGEGQTGTPPSAETDNDQSAEVPAIPVHSDPVTSPSTLTPPKKHKSYWLNGHYYENPEYPEHIARAMFACPQS